MNWKKMIAVIACAMTLTSVMAGCGQDKSKEASKDASSTEIVAYGVIDPQISAQQIIADKKGYFKEEGLNVTNKFIQSGGDMSSLISGGSAQVSFESPYTDIALAANGVGIKIVAPMANIGNTQAVVAGKNANIVNGKDLEGKKVGIPAGAGVMIAIRNMCNELNVDINKIQFVTLSPSDAIAALEKGDIDAMACWEPWISNAQNNGGKLLFSGLKSYLGDKQGDVNWMNFYTTMQVSDTFLKEHPEEVKAMLRALKKATDFINENPDEAAEIIAKEINLDATQVKKIMSQNQYQMLYDDKFVNSCDEIANFMKETNNISSKPDFGKYADSSILKSVDETLVTAK
ncbi:MAG: ABC transporter substrate-binding protein [Megamonas funiformis]|uniref:ABC transporter substrate-binding protein n=1 Tax=Megamonas funiformis TaxID=437897 RepID=UPI00399446A4